MERNRCIDTFAYLAQVMKELERTASNLEGADACDLTSAAVCYARAQTAIRRAARELQDAVETIMDALVEDEAEGRLKP